MVPSCFSPCEDGLLPAAPARGSLSAAQSGESENESVAVSSRLSSNHQLMQSSQLNHLLVENLLAQQLIATGSVACNSSLLAFPTAAACTSARGSLEKAIRDSEAPTRRHGAGTRSRTVKDGTPSSSTCMKRSSAAAYNGRKSAETGARVRARRGEATDKHSISERTRRTKITERMQALHRLIPDASKTIKSSMLEEVIQHVRTLQARLKMECTSKFDSGDEAFSTKSPNAIMDIEGWRKSCNRVFVNKMIERVLDPQEEKLAEVERQVLIRLSRPRSADLSLASTYLASLGLALVPISHLPSRPLNTNVSFL